ncbi:hypothetical protein DVA86_05055 [Streptomyces armeniacus]|uniref:Uncharacterized protein n=1 Tax=Streptomyces armeniacus TaxID=83291 RepID=A0A345XKF1_9ACTN|nr:hypothetical protein [Streptomyces armeniacus]AXK32117.1 hypothetical protein DVA86_05055 [Streptomyces armeniacus]
MTPVTDADFERAGGLSPRAVLRYLRSRGWSYDRDYGRGELWTLAVPQTPGGPFAGGPPYEVLVPLDRTRDYAARIADVLETLSTVEARSPGQLLREMALPSADWQFLRLAPPGPSGTAPLVDLVPALAGLKDVMTAAAAAAFAAEPQSVQPAQKPQRVKDHVATVRLDQTRVGSYVIAAHTPLSEPPPPAFLPLDGRPDSVSEPAERLVSRRLWAGVYCARQAAEQAVRDDTLDHFAEFAPAGLSANLCEALVRIAGDERRPYDFTFAWSGDLPMDQKTPPVDLNRRLFVALEAGAKDLRERLGHRNVLVHGNVVRLDRALTHGPGEATVLGNLEGEGDRRPRRYRMVLEEQDYSRASVAHDRGHEVAVRGDVVARGGHARVEPVTEFAVTQATD